MTTKTETPNKPAYAILHYTLCDGWVNSWAILNEDGTSEPETFETEAMAQAALDEYLAEITQEIALGQRDADEGYDPEDFRIEKVVPI